MNLDEMKTEIYGAVGAVTGVLTLLSLHAFVTQGSGFSSFLWNLLGWGVFYVIFISGIISGLSLFYFWINHAYRKEFRDLMNTTSKAKFVRSLDRIEYLAWKLGKPYEEMVERKRKEFGIKKRR